MEHIEIESRYLVRLEGGETLPAKDRMKAETRFSAALEKSLGGAEGVVEALRAFLDAVEADEEVRPSLAAQATSWQRACEAARQTSMRELGDDVDVFFDVRLT